MESRSRETTPTKEDLDFIVDDGYRHDEDPVYVPDEKYVLTGPEFKRLTLDEKLNLMIFDSKTNLRQI